MLDIEPLMSAMDLVRSLTSSQDIIHFFLFFIFFSASLLVIFCIGARDGPALLDQVLEVKKAMPNFPIIANGNIITYNDVCSNLKSTNADGVMSAEGILDNPALYLPRFRDENQESIQVHTVVQFDSSSSNKRGETVSTFHERDDEKQKRKLAKKLREIEALELKKQSQPKLTLSIEEMEKMSKKEHIEREMKLYSSSLSINSVLPSFTTKLCTIQELEAVAHDKLQLAREYLALVQLYPVKLRSVIFHIRRMLKQELNQYQLMEECVGSTHIDQIHMMLEKMIHYTKNPISFQYNVKKAKREKDALDNKRREEGKRKEYEARMIRKAKREGKEDVEFYLRKGTCVPTWKEIQQLKLLPREKQLELWKEKNHAQHCMAYHLNEGGCQRDRACCFLHIDSQRDTTFVEMDEMAG